MKKSLEMSRDFFVGGDNMILSHPHEQYRKIRLQLQNPHLVENEF